MNAPRTKRWHKILIGQGLVTLLIAIIGGSLVFYSQGYRINWENMKIYKTGVILIGVDPKPDKIIINDQIILGSSFVSKTAIAGNYNISVAKEGYYIWQNRVRVEAEKLYDFRNIVLFRNDATISELTDKQKIDYLNSPSDVLIENSERGLGFNKYEIWLDDSLVTRFSKPISSAEWFYDMKHILFQQGKEIRVIDIDGYNNVLLVKLSSDSKTKYAVGGKGKELYFYDKGKYYLAEIR